MVVIPKSAVGQTGVDEQQSRFVTYLNYLEALRRYLSEETWRPAHQIASLRSGPSFRRLQRNTDVNKSAVSKYLRNSWATELQLRAPTSNPEILGVANHWATVQLYYAVYLSLRALFIAANREVATNHRAALRTIAADVEKRSGLFPLPWKVCCKGGAMSSSAEFLCIPKDVEVREISNLSSVGRDEFWSSYAMLLRTTRKRQIDERADQWKHQHKKKRLKKGGRIEIAENLHPTTLFDFLYRLRIRSNYSDADSFIETLDDGESAQRFNSSLIRICWCSCLILEAQTCEYVGRKAFGELVDEYCDRIGPGADSVRKRWTLLE